jgi:hypothetical protein
LGVGDGVAHSGVGVGVEEDGDDDTGWRSRERRHVVSVEKRKGRDAGGSTMQRRALTTECGVTRRNRREKQGRRVGSDSGSVKRNAWRASATSRGGVEVWMGLVSAMPERGRGEVVRSVLPPHIS